MNKNQPQMVSCLPPVSQTLKGGTICGCVGCVGIIPKEITLTEPIWFEIVPVIHHYCHYSNGGYKVVLMPVGAGAVRDRVYPVRQLSSDPAKNSLNQAHLVQCGHQRNQVMVQAMVRTKLQTHLWYFSYSSIVSRRDQRNRLLRPAAAFSWIHTRLFSSGCL